MSEHICFASWQSIRQLMMMMITTTTTTTTRTMIFDDDIGDGGDKGKRDIQLQLFALHLVLRLTLKRSTFVIIEQQIELYSCCNVIRRLVGGYAVCWTTGVSAIHHHPDQNRPDKRTELLNKNRFSPHQLSIVIYNRHSCIAYNKVPSQCALSVICVFYFTSFEVINFFPFLLHFFF